MIEGNDEKIIEDILKEPSNMCDTAYLIRSEKLKEFYPAFLIMVKPGKNLYDPLTIERLIQMKEQIDLVIKLELEEIDKITRETKKIKKQ